MNEELIIDKKCKVCNIICNSNLNIDFKNELINFIKTGCKHNEFILFTKEKGKFYNEEIDYISKHLLNLHQEKCLSLDLKSIHVKCVVCKSISNNKDLDIILKDKLNNFIKSGCTEKEFIDYYNEIKEFYNVNIDLPTKHYLEYHQKECLGLDLKSIHKDKKLQNNSNDKEDKKDKSTFQQDIDMTSILEDYREKTFQERETDYLRMLREVDYMSLVSIHHQLQYGKYSGAVVPKEDISALKNIQDILQVITADTFDDEELPQIDINVINTQITNDEILQQYEFPLSQDPSIEYKKLSETSTNENIIEENVIEENVVEENVVEKVTEEEEDNKVEHKEVTDFRNY